MAAGLALQIDLPGTGSPRLQARFQPMDVNPIKQRSCNELADFSKSVGAQMARVNALLIVNTILMGVMLGIGAYGHRYRHRPLTRLLFLGATTLFLPIISYVVSTIGSDQFIISVPSNGKFITGVCSTRGHIFLVLLWTGLVQIIGINTTTVVAADPREGRNIAPPVVLLVQAVWTSYLAIYTAGVKGQEGFYFPEFCDSLQSSRGLILFLLFTLIFAKTILKYYMFYEAGKSFALGRNPGFVVTYMKKIQGTNQQHINENITPPPLIVMGEDIVHQKNQHQGYCIRWIMSDDQGDITRLNNDGLMTMDKVWHSNDMLLRSTPQGQQLKDLCFSFALFKLLRCRFARYKAAEDDFMKVRKFFCQVLLNETNDERVLGIVTNELSFLHDCYYSSQPISYSKCWLLILGVLFSLLSISYCLVLLTGRTLLAVTKKSIWQMRCSVTCGGNDAQHFQGFGNLLFDLVPVFLLLAIVILSEARDITWYICSGWTKIAIIYGYRNHVSWDRSPVMRKCISLLMECRCKLVKSWVDIMNQSSVLPLPPRRTTMLLLRYFLHLPEQKKNVKMPTVVKAAILDKLRNCLESLSDGVISLHRTVHVGDDLLWECNNNDIAHTILVWHIATSIFEVRHLQPQEPESSVVQKYKITATHLSRYCAYLVMYSPELLPGDDEWCKTLYKAVKKDTMRVLALADRSNAVSPSPESEFRHLVDLLVNKSEHKVLKNGVKLGDRLSQLCQGEEEMGWKTLADFWLEIILYVSPSDHFDGHAEAVARGGELITILWVLLAHVGIVSREEAATTTTPVDGGNCCLSV